MPDRFEIPDNKITTPRKNFTIGLQQSTGRLKAKLISASLPPQESDTPVALSAYLGTPVYSQFILKKAIDTVVGNEQTGTDYAKFESVIATVNQQRNIIRTPIQGRNGTVKEYIADGDFEISIHGRIIGKFPQKSPAEEVENIVGLLRQPNELIIVSSYLNLFSIQYVVIMDYHFSQVAA
jgi:hypothetical protein